MKITLIQTSLTWENPAENRNRFTTLINTIDETDLIVLPEMFSTGFTMNAESVAEPMEGETAAWMKKMSAEKHCAITGSLVISENGNCYNRLLFVEPEGTIHTYDKRHLFTLAGEDKSYTAGSARTVINYRGWKICPLVCYDLRFPVFSRNTEDFDLLLYVANWPEVRIGAWDALLKARAIENMCYVAGVNRIGQDDNGHNYPGHSVAIDYLGNIRGDAGSRDEVITVTLNKKRLVEARKKFGFLNDRDSFTLLS
ncbi:MAG: amidohydrolase [Flavobacterium sp.]